MKKIIQITKVINKDKTKEFLKRKQPFLSDSNIDEIIYSISKNKIEWAVFFDPIETKIVSNYFEFKTL